ncbi:MAG: alpha/beta fold hydrolase [Mycobacterium sp.]
MSNTGTRPPHETLKIPAGDVTMVGDAYGDPSDPPVVLLHGGGQTRHSWGSTAADLGAKNWYAVTVDLRGHGDSSWSPDGYYGLDRFANDVTRVADFLGRPPVLVAECEATAKSDSGNTFTGGTHRDASSVAGRQRLGLLE